MGYLVAIAWPLSHILILVAIYEGIGRAPPYGDSIAVVHGHRRRSVYDLLLLVAFHDALVIQARPLLAFPEVKVLDILLASAILETLAASCVTVALVIIALFIGVDPMPRDIVQAACALGSAVLLGLGFGMLNGVIAFAIPLWFAGYSILSIFLWITAGVIFRA